MASLVMNPLMGSATDFPKIKKEVGLLPKISSVAMATLAVLKKNNPSLSIPDFLQTPLSERVAALEAAEQNYQRVLNSEKQDQKDVNCRVAACTGSLFLCGGAVGLSNGALLVERTFSLLCTMSAGASWVFLCNDLHFRDEDRYVSRYSHPLCMPCMLIDEARFSVPYRIEQKRLRVAEEERALESSFEEMKGVCAENAEFPLKRDLESRLDAMRKQHEILWENNFTEFQRTKQLSSAGREIVELEGKIQSTEGVLREINTLITFVREKILG